jgi:transketolase
MVAPMHVPEGLRTSDTAEVSARAIRQIILEQSKRAHVGHIGSALSIVEIVTALYGDLLRMRSPDDPDRDRFVLSKGHAALALYAALYLRGWISFEQLDTYCADNTLLGVHPERFLCGVDFSSGSLGQGLPTATGAALAGRLRRSDRRVFALVSDAECNEGALWEAVMFAAHHHLSNLFAVVDMNGQQALGYTKDVLSLNPLEQRWRAFGWDVHVVDGHDIGTLVATVRTAAESGDPRPHVLIANTVFGRGVSFMERQIKWHYSPMSDEEYALALAETSALS